MLRRNFLKGAAALAGVALLPYKKVQAKQEIKRINKFIPSIKPDRISTSEIYMFCDQKMSRGAVVSIIGDGCVGRQQKDKIPLGVSLNDVVDIDCTRAPINYHSDCTTLGGKISVMNRGTITTSVPSEVKAGDVALAYDGVINNKTGIPVGIFLTSSDEDGFAKVTLQ